MRNVICTKWGSKFSPDYVNRLARMVARHLAPPYRFVCFTDDAEGLDAGIDAFPLPPVPVVGERNDHGWKKLGVFVAAPGDLHGTALCLDLDVVITGDLAPLFEMDGAFRVIRDYRNFRFRHHYTGNTSVFRFEIGAHADMLDEVAIMGADVRRAFRNEQEVVSSYMHRRGLLQYWPMRWCPSYKHDCVWPMPLGLLLRPRQPADARVIVFHGDPNPEEAVHSMAGSKWYRIVRPAPWLRDYMI